MCRETGTGTETGSGTGSNRGRGRALMKIQDDARDKKTHRRRRQQSGRLTVWQPGEAGTARGERGTGTTGRQVESWPVSCPVVSLVSQRRFNVAHIIHSLRFYYFMFVLFVILTR